MNRKIRYWIIEAAGVLAILVCLFIYMFPKFLEAQNINTPENFPDPVFLQVVEDSMRCVEGLIHMNSMEFIKT